MKIKLRPNLTLMSRDEEMDSDITAIVTTSSLRVDDPIGFDKKGAILTKFSLHAENQNKPYVKDFVCHSVKQLIENGEKVLIILDDDTSIFVASRVLCEVEEKNIYEIFNELKQIMPNIDYLPIYYT